MTREEAILKVREEFERLKGKVVRVDAINCYRKNSDDRLDGRDAVCLDPPHRVRLVELAEEGLWYDVDEWVDALYYVEPVEHSTALEGMEGPFSILGRALNIDTNEWENGNIVEVED